MSRSVPRLIHYCWFGENAKPAQVERCIRSWREVLPDYEIREWNERNFDIAAWVYARQAYDAGKFAFVSDVARLHALFVHGGIYLDTDVEVRRAFDPLLENEVVLGFEEGFYVATSTMLAIPGSRLIGDFLRGYQDRAFLKSDGSFDQGTNVQVLTAMLEGAGLLRNGAEQELDWKGERLRVLDRVALSPFDYSNGIDHTAERTFAFHQFGHSWGSPWVRLKATLRRCLIRAIGGERVKRLRVVGARVCGSGTDERARQ